MGLSVIKYVQRLALNLIMAQYELTRQSILEPFPKTFKNFTLWGSASPKSLLYVKGWILVGAKVLFF